MIIDEVSIRHRFEAVCGQLDERGVRLLAAAEARAAGYGGIAAVSRATGIARSTIGRGLADLDRPALAPGQVRRAGSGRKPVQETDPTLLADLRRLVEPATLGDPMRLNEAATTTTRGLTVDCVLDPRRYAKGIKVSD